MYKEPENYEEAKQILYDSVHNDMFKRQVRITRLRSGVVTAAALGVSYAISQWAGNPGLMSGFTLLSAGLGISNLLPNVGMRKAANSVEDGSFFEEKSEAEVIRLAKNYAKLYNEYEKIEGKSR